jgi:hypothetical protein
VLAKGRTCWMTGFGTAQTGHLELRALEGIDLRLGRARPNSSLDRRWRNAGEARILVDDEWRFVSETGAGDATGCT